MAAGCSFGVPWPEFNAGVKYHDKITATDQSMTLLEFYCIRHKNSASKEGWLQRIRNEQIRVDGGIANEPDFVLRMGAHLEYHRLPWKEPAAPHHLQILYEDEHIVALNKPAGLQVLPGGLFQQRTVLTQLQCRDKHDPKLSSRANNSSATDESWTTSPVHRLGRGTSGVLLCAKTPQAKSRLAADIAEGTQDAMGRSEDRRPNIVEGGRGRRFLKTYRALASGLIDLNEAIVDQPIGRVPFPGVRRGLYMATSTGKPSLSKVVVLWRNEVDKCTLVQVEILTGRPHQIRIHLAAMGHPLLDDPLYVAGGRPLDCAESSALHGQDPAEDGGYQRPGNALPGDIGYLLHAWRLEFVHPVFEKKLSLTAAPPPSLRAPEEKHE